MSQHVIRTGSITMAGTISAPIVYYKDLMDDPSDPQTRWLHEFNLPHITITVPFGTAKIEITCQSGGSPSYVTLAVNNGIGGAQSQWQVPDPSTKQTLNLSGNWSVTVDADLVFDDAADGSNDSDGFPTYGGSTAKDMPFGAKASLYWVSHVGGNAVATANLGGLSATKTDAITTASTIGQLIGASIASVLENTTSVDTVTFSWSGSSIPTSWSHSDSYGVTISASGNTLSTAGALQIDDDNVQISVSAAPVRAANLSGHIYALGGNYPDGLQVVVKDSLSHTQTLSPSGGSFSCAIAQHNYSVAGSIGSTTYPSVSVNEWEEIRAWITTASLAALGEDAKSWRIPLHCFVYDALNVGQSASYVVDGGFSFSPSAPATRAPGVNLGSYRYLQAACGSAAAGHKVGLALGSKTWTVTCDSSGVATIDLCAPTNASAATDATDSYWEGSEGPYWGVGTPASMVWTSLDSGVTCTVPTGGITLVAQDHRHLSILPGMADYVHQSSGTVGGVTTDTYLRRMLDGDTDGRRSLEEWDASRTDSSSSGGSSTAYEERSIASLCTGITDTVSSGALRWPGWSASVPAAANHVDDSTPLTGYLNANRPATWLHGSGCLYNGGAWSTLIDADVSSSATIKAQTIIDALTAWPGDCGDVFGVNGGASTGALEIGCGCMLRGQAWGLVIDANGPASSATVDVLDHSGATVATGTTSALGEYASGAAYMLGGANYTVKRDGGTSSVAITPAINRKRSRACFGRIVTGAAPWLLESLRGLLHCVHGSSGVVYRRSDSVSPSSGWAQTTQVTSDNTDTFPRVSVDTMRRVHVVYQHGSDTYWTSSDDEGEHWRVPVAAITGGTRPTIAQANDSSGLMVIAAYVSGAIVARTFWPGQSTLSDAFTFADTSGAALQVADDSFHILPAHEPSRRWMMHCHISGEAATSVWASSDDCLHWSRLT